MRAVVLGGTGTAGRFAVEALRERGHDVVAVSRSSGVDARTGAGLDDALTGAEVVVDAINTPSLRGSVAHDFFTTSARHLQLAAAGQGVQHLVVLSILGIDRVRGYPYYQAKLAQERAATAGAVPVTVLRAAQFHEFPGQLLDRTRVGPFAVVPHMRSQPVAARTVGAHLAALAEDRPGGVVELAGPEVHDVVDLARRLVAVRPERLHVLGVTVPGSASRDMRGGALLAGRSTRLDGPTFDGWLRDEHPRSSRRGGRAA